MGRVLTALLYLGVLVGVALGTLLLVDAFISANGAPQQAAGAGLAVACVVIPYCLARAAEKLRGLAGETRPRVGDRRP